MTDYTSIISFLQNHDTFKGTITQNENLAQKCTFKVGGNADVFIAPNDYFSFQLALSCLVQNNIKFYIIGGGSNILFPSSDFHGVILSTQNFNDSMIFPAANCPEDFGPIHLEKNQTLVTCFSGTPMAAFVNFCTQNDLSGAEQFAGLPGSVGGAAFMNARCFEKSISDILFYVTYMDYSTPDITLHHTLYNPEEWAYKKSPFQDVPYFITTVTFLLTHKYGGEQASIQKECKKYISERVSKGHFKFPSAGSVFKNNHNFGKPSGQLIDECGLKGFQIGGAQIAPFHGNFIINTNNASSEDIKELIKTAQKKVKEKFNFDLEPEIILL